MADLKSIIKEQREELENIEQKEKIIAREKLKDIKFEEVINLQTGQIDKEHSNNPVPCIIVARELENKAGSGQLVTDDLSKLTPAGVLADVAPTMLKIMGLNKPADMSGQSLL